MIHRVTTPPALRAGRALRVLRALSLSLGVALLASGCASAPVVVPAAPTVPLEQKMTWMLQLEDQRILKLPEPPPPPPVAPVKGRRPAPLPPPPASVPDLHEAGRRPRSRACGGAPRSPSVAWG